VTEHVVPLSSKTVRSALRRPTRRLAWQHGREWLDVLLALGSSTLACAVLESYLDPANLVMVYMAGVAYVASRSGRAQAMTMIGASIVLYDLIFVAPRWSLKPAEPQDWLAFVVMMVVGLLISQLAARSREQAMLAEARAQRAQALNQLSMALGRARDAEAVSQVLCTSVRTSVGVAATVVPFREGHLLDGVSDGIADRLPQGYERDRALQALACGGETGAGSSTGPEEPLRYVPLTAGEEPFGVLVMQSPQPHRDTLEDRHLIRALANQAAVALERAVLERRGIEAAIATEGERTRNTLLSAISHDFRTPLTTIIGSATTLIEQGEAIDEFHRQSLLRGLHAEAQRLHLLSSNLLDLTRLDEGAIQLRPEWCPADELIEEALTALQANLGSLNLVIAVEPDQVVWCDPRLVSQVLVNLVDNAIRHSPSGGSIQVRVSTSDQAWSVSVHDQGTGIPAGHEKAIFRKFYRAAEDGDSTGKGLGLAICAAVARLHRGEIRVDNDGGARFVMTLPQPELTAMARRALE
jgi:two-component system sensor histidine kinase KdpD